MTTFTDGRTAGGDLAIRQRRTASCYNIIQPGGSMRSYRRYRAWAMALLLAAVASFAVSPPAQADDGGVEYLYTAGDTHLDARVQAVTDTADVLLAMEWMPTVDGAVNGARICLDLDAAQVNARLPLFAYLWDVNGQLLALGGAYEGITRSDPCFYDVGFSSVQVTAGQHYVIGFWVRGGQYSYVPSGFNADVSSASGHLIGLSNADSTICAGNGLYAYTSLIGTVVPFPTNSWQNSDYLISPRFTPNTE
jgi:hypothetical protein